MDVNTACTSFLYGLTTASAMIKSGVVRNALVIGGELISPMMDWSNRNVAILFGDGCAAVVLQATDREEGVLADRLGCFGDARGILQVHGMGAALREPRLGARRHGLGVRGPGDLQARGRRHERSLRGSACKAATPAADVDLVVPHQANLRIIEAVVKRAASRWSAASSTSSATATCPRRPCRSRSCEALEAGRVKPGCNLLLMPGFGAGLTFRARAALG